MTNKKYKIKIEEYPAAICATAKTGNWLFDYNDVPFEISYWKEPRKVRINDNYYFWHETIFDTKVNCITDRSRTNSDLRTYYYRNEKFTGDSAIVQLGRHYEIEHSPLLLDVLKKYEPIIKSLEERVGKILIDR